MTTSPTPPIRCAISKEDPLQLWKTTLGEQASHQGNLLLVSEKQCLRRASSEHLRKISEFNNITETAAQNDVVQQRPLSSSTILRAEEGKEGQSHPAKLKNPISNKCM